MAEGVEIGVGRILGERRCGFEEVAEKGCIEEEVVQVRHFWFLTKP